MKAATLISYICLFLTVLFLGDRFLFYTALSIVQHSRNQFVRMYEGKLPADVLILGDSRADRNISTRELQDLTGKRCLNLGLGGNSVLISETLLKDFVQRYGKPERVLIELSHTTADPYSMGEMRIFSYCSPNIAALAKQLDPTYSLFECIFKCLQFNDPAFWRLAAELLGEPAPRLLENTIPPEIINKWKDGHHIDLPIIRNNMEALTRICQYSESKDIRIELLIGPSWEGFRNGIANYEEWKSALVRVVGIHFIHDYSRVFFDHPEYFNDTIHLNAIGADRFAEILVKDKIL
jgi:hypothetical protein